MVKFLKTLLLQFLFLGVCASFGFDRNVSDGDSGFDSALSSRSSSISLDQVSDIVIL